MDEVFGKDTAVAASLAVSEWSAHDQVMLRKFTVASKWIWSFDSGAGPILEATRAREMRTQTTSWTPSMTRQPLQGLGAAIASAVSSAGRPGG
jgi:hypothetical protein